MSKAGIICGVTIAIRGGDGTFAVEIDLIWPNECGQSIKYEGRDFGEALKVALDVADDAYVAISIEFRPGACG
jgi:hypothetical protein